MLTIEAKLRNTKSEKADDVRKGGFVPAVFYGRKESSTPISVSRKDFLKIWKEAGESSIITLSGLGKEGKQVLIQEVTQDPVSDIPTHIDFYAVQKDRKLEIRVPIKFEGVSTAVKDLGGILVKVLHELEIQSLPADLPYEIVVDIKPLTALDSQILAGDIILPKGVELVTDAKEVIAAVSVAKEEEEAPATPIDLSSIEVEKKGKEVVPGAPGEAEAGPAGK